MGINAVQIIENQISEIQHSITDTKIGIADLFVKMNRIDVSKIHSPKDLFDSFSELDKMPKYLSDLKEYEVKLDTLEKSKTEILKTSDTAIIE